MLELLITLIFAVVVIAGVVQIARSRPRIEDLRREIGEPGELSADAYERRASIAQWESQRDLIVAAALLLLSGVALTSVGDPLRRVFPAWSHGVGVAIFFAIGIIGVTLTISRSAARTGRLGLRCRYCEQPLPTSGDRLRETIRLGRCPSCRRMLFTPRS
jgi:hypothetical protein